MIAEPGTGSLDSVYAATSAAEVARAYDAWADGYEAEMTSVGYRHPAVCVSLVARHVPKGAAPLLDAGAGTGLIGEWLSILGYPRLDAVDLSPGMLRIAADKAVYARLVEADLSRNLPFETGYYAAAVCAGVFTLGHVGPEGLDELLRVVRPGGTLVLTVKEKTWTDGFADRLDRLASDGAIASIDETPPYLSMPGRPESGPSRGIVLRRL